MERLHRIEALFNKKRQILVKKIRRKGIRDERVLDAMLSVPRHFFVEARFGRDPYEDHAQEIGFGQTISQPFIVALMTEGLSLGEEDRVLEIGTGSGYQSAVLSRICKEVYSVEIIEPLALKAKDRFRRLSYKNIEVKIGDGYFGWKEKAPFDGVIVTCAVASFPKPLLDQLKDGGRIIAPLSYGKEQILTLGIKKGKSLEIQTKGRCAFVPLRRVHLDATH